MTLDGQITIMAEISKDRKDGGRLAANFQDYATESPISSTREQEIVAEFNAHVQALGALYLEILKACSEWIDQQ